MGADQHIDWAASAASTLEWWRDAGVDILVDDLPRDWRARAQPAPPPAAVTETPALPDTLAAFVAWRLERDAHGARRPPVGPEGDPAADLAVIVDFPEGAALLDGAPGRLFDRMLAAIGRERASIYLIPLATVRPLGDRILPEAEGALAELVRHHVALAAPKQLLCLGQSASRALIGTDAARGPRSLHSINLNSLTVGVVASVHPRALIEQPMLKAIAWRDLQLLMRNRP